MKEVMDLLARAATEGHFEIKRINVESDAEGHDVELRLEPWTATEAVDKFAAENEVIRTVSEPKETDLLEAKKRLAELAGHTGPTPSIAEVQAAFLSGQLGELDMSELVESKEHLLEALNLLDPNKADPQVQKLKGDVSKLGQGVDLVLEAIEGLKGK